MPELTLTPAVAAALGVSASSPASLAASSASVQALSLDGGTVTSKIQAALDSMAASGGGTVYLGNGESYALTRAGTKSVLNASGSTTSQGYCLMIPSGVVLDLNGSTLVNGDSTDSALVTNENTTLTTDHDLGVVNGTLDGNDVQLSATALALFTGCTRLRLHRLRIVNAKRYGILTYNNDESDFDDLVADDCAANPFSFGQPFANKEERDARIGRVTARNITADAVAPNTCPGNCFYGVLTNSTIETLVGDTCSGGVKIQGPGTDVTIGKVVFVNGTADNSGFKTQDGAKRVTVGQVVCENNEGYGVFSEDDCEDIHIGSYVGSGNTLNGTHPDVWVDGIRPSFGTIHSRHAGVSGIEVRATASRARIGQALIVNPGQVTGSASGSSVGVAAGAGSCVIGSLICVDDQVSRTMLRGLAINHADSRLLVNDYTYACTDSGATAFNAWTGDDVLVLNPRIGANDLHGELSPAVGETATSVSNDNLTTIGSTVQPIVEFVPLNASAQALGLLRATFSAGAMSVKHGSAAGTEKIGYRVVGYRKSVTAAA